MQDGTHTAAADSGCMTHGAPSASASLDTWLSYLESIHAKTMDLGLDRVREVARRLDLRLPCTTITVAGTNGKGSTCAMLEAILLAAGYRVGTYTSPHLVRFNERARLDGEPVDDAALIGQFVAVEAARGEVSLTYFEFTTLAILRLFAHSGLDVAILEVGLGGRLDAVNIIDADCAIVTSIDLDHTEWLGSTREEIGREKAHIFRSGKPAICTDPQLPESVLKYAREIGADLRRFGVDFNYTADRQQWNWAGRERRRNAMAYPALRGANQLLNASGVLAALESLEDRLAVPQQAVRQGLLNVRLPGRFQIIPGRPTLILDVAHNPHAVAVLAQNLDSMGFFPYTYAVFGMLADKDVDAVIAQLGDRIDHWYCTNLTGPRAASADFLADRLRAAGIPEADADRSITLCDTPSQALAMVRERATENDRIVVFGSFLTVAEVLSHGDLYAQARQ